VIASLANVTPAMTVSTMGIASLVLYASLVAAVGEKPMRVSGASPTV
jgi:hypothetical protein